MLVYGDHSDIVDPRLWLDRICGLLDEAHRLGGLARHSKLVTALVEAGRLQQGLADRGFCEEDRAGTLTCELARCVVRSWDGSFAETGPLPIVPSIASTVRLKLRVPEGFAFYAVYPEAYLISARKLRLSAPPRVIGIRSIGTTLSAVVAVALGAPRPLTVRPFGDSFARQIELPAETVEPGAHYVIVDEGPGLSGSSFGAVADALEAHGIPPARIAFLPSHDGDLGPLASDAHRARWRTAQRPPAKFDAASLMAAFGPLQPLAVGGPWQRTKYLGHSGLSQVLLKFAGLGSLGERKFEMARTLYQAHLSPQPLDLVHGFLVERWRDDAAALSSSDKPAREIGHYIGTRSRLFPAEPDSGASIQEMMGMCRRNLSLAMGNETAKIVDRWDAEQLSRAVGRVRTDNKLDRCEWLRLPGGQLLKTDAVDHHRSHDLIGCQDMAWDVAGALVEFALDDESAQQLIDCAETSGKRQVDSNLLRFYHTAYCCFRMGQAELAAGSCSDTAQSEPLRSRSTQYAAALVDVSERSTPRIPFID